MAPEQPQRPAGRPKLHLPFEKRRIDAGEWAYDHRTGLAATLIAYLLLAILFVGARIVIDTESSAQGVYIDLQTLAELEAERDRLERIALERAQVDPIDWSDIRNRTSNENALDEQLRDDRGTRTSELNRSATEAQERMQANREAYRQGLEEAREMGMRDDRQPSDSDSERRDARIQGRVTVSYAFADPVRQGRYIEIPAYRCEGGGEVTVEVAIDRSGNTVGARVRAGGDECMREAALHAARNSRFNIDASAPARQSGTITYLFIPQ